MKIKCTIDVDILLKGQVLTLEDIPPGDIMPAGLRARSERQYFQGVFIWSKQLQSLLIASGRPWTVIQRKDDIIILTDAEATTYNHSQFEGYIGRLEQRHDMAKGVDFVQLTAHEQNLHLRRLIRQGITLNNIDAAQREEIAVDARRNPKRQFLEWEREARARAEARAEEERDD